MKADHDQAEVDLAEQTFRVKQSLQRFLEEKGHEDTKTVVLNTSDKLNDRMNVLYMDIGKLKLEQQKSLKEDYTSEYIKASNDYTEFVERETEADLRAELEREKIEVTNLRAELLQSTIKLTLQQKEKKIELSKLQSVDSELDEELSFLTNQQKFGEEQNALLEKKVAEMYSDLRKLKPDAPELEELQLMEVLPVALKKKEPEFPQLLELRTRKNFHAMRDTKNSKFGNSNKYGDNKMGLGASNGHDNQSENQKKSNDDAVQDPFKANYDELQRVYGFLTENKYVIEAIFENVLLENNLYKFPLSVISDTERKQLMEKLMSNDEFKEYIYQKIIRGQDITKEDTVEPAKREHLVSQAATQADGANMSVQYSSIINADVATKEAK